MSLPVNYSNYTTVRAPISHLSKHRCVSLLVCISNHPVVMNLCFMFQLEVRALAVTRNGLGLVRNGLVNRDHFGPERTRAIESQHRPPGQLRCLGGGLRVGGPGTPPFWRTREEFCKVWNSAR